MKRIPAGTAGVAVHLARRVRVAGVRFDRQAAIEIGPVVEEADGTRLLPLWWEAAEHPGLFPTFDGGLQVCPHDRGTELRLEGTTARRSGRPAASSTGRS